MPFFPRHTLALRLTLLAICIAMVAGASVSLVSYRNGKAAPLTERLTSEEDSSSNNGASPAIEVSPLSPLNLEPVTPPPPPPPAAREAMAAPKPAAKAKPAPAAPRLAAPAIPAPAPSLPSAVGPYRGLGAWVDIFDYHTRPEVTAKPMLDEMSRRGVKTVFLQTSRFKQPEDILNPAKVGEFIDVAHARGIAVVAWYVPGFGHLDRDIRSSMAAIDFKSSTGQSFDGFAPDIETGDDLIAGDRARFNSGIAEYSRRLREAAGGRVLGAIVVDAKNNERAPAKWSGFPWPQIAEFYDVVLPMAYWSVTKAGNCAAEYDTAQYMRDVYDKTQALMGMHRPLNIIGGIGNCISHSETAHMVDGLLERGDGLIGGGLYDFETQQANPARDGIWSELARLNR